MRHSISQYRSFKICDLENFQLPSGRFNEDGTMRYLTKFCSCGRRREHQRLSRSRQPRAIGCCGCSLSFVDVCRHIRIRGKEGAGLSIRKESDANTIETTNAVKEAFEELKENTLSISFHSLIKAPLYLVHLDNLKEAALTSGVFAIVILYLFLRNMPMTLIIAGCIPFTLTV